MGHWSYIAMLVVCLLGTLPLEFVFGARVYRKPLRLVITLIPVLLVFIIWDLYAISEKHWWFDDAQTSLVRFIGGLPLDEVLFFIAIPICSILTLEAVRSLSGWTVGDESE